MTLGLKGNVNESNWFGRESVQLYATSCLASN